MRNTAGINTTVNQERFRGKAIAQTDKIQTPLEAAKYFLRSALVNGPVLQRDIETQAEANGINPEAMMQAMKSLEVACEQGQDGFWYLSLRTEEPIAQILSGEFLPPGYNGMPDPRPLDEFALTPEEKTLYNIPADWQYGWIRDDRIWGKVDGHGSRARQFLRENAGSEIVMYDGEYVTNGSDLILTMRPMSEVEKLRTADRKKEVEQERRFSEEVDADEEFDPNNRSQRRERKRRNTEEHVRAGMIGPASPSQGLAYEDYIRNRGMTAKQIAEEENQFSLGPFYGRELEGAQAQSVIDQRRDSGGKFISIPANVRPRNLQQARP